MMMMTMMMMMMTIQCRMTRNPSLYNLAAFLAELRSVDRSRFYIR